jgi:hypothetical protein
VWFNIWEELADSIFRVTEFASGGYWTKIKYFLLIISKLPDPKFVSLKTEAVCPFETS